MYVFSLICFFIFRKLMTHMNLPKKNEEEPENLVKPNGTYMEAVQLISTSLQRWWQVEAGPSPWEWCWSQPCCRTEMRQSAGLAAWLLQGWLRRHAFQARGSKRSPGQTCVFSLWWHPSPNLAGRIPLRGLGLFTLKRWFILICAAFSTCAKQRSFTHRFPSCIPL